ncbi:TetR/AcrR family transcriptional regulator [Curtobacterium aurantiacum]|uniref:TetR/AcrR family transcriptional regulator n=1 Tax=Curtobacterium aurantiacum TaxID=3236919 RepID=UPI001BE0F1D1|nr:TetR/AcrR family transcriptional regulator [Curtobacterium flaccumfaciens]MBT1677443.1 TetR/AcrR family transcriptional regulator [Curtobacterium flaccumfaciens pv. flaccumfaciens]
MSTDRRTGVVRTGTDGSRDRERTRQAVLESAHRLLAERGTRVSVAEIATDAGVSKSGLLHHFPSKDELLLAVVEHGLAAFTDEVMRHVDLAENRPGKVLRAYVRALCGGSEQAMELFAPSSHWTGLMAVPGIAAVVTDDAEHWRTLFARDGLPEDRTLVVRHAAEGLAAAAGMPPYLAERELAVARDALLALAEPV